MSFLVVVVVTFVLIESELCISSRINTESESAPVTFNCVLCFFSPRNDATCTNIKRRVSYRCVSLDVLSTVEQSVGPEVKPFCSCREINIIGLCLRPVALRPTIHKFLSVSNDFLAVLFVPTAHFVGLDNLLLREERVNNRANQEVAAKHILTVVVPYILVVLEVHHKCTHERIVIFRYLPRETVDVRHQAIAHADCTAKSVIDRFARFAVIVEFTINFSTVAAHHRTEETELHPANVEFLILRILGS